MLVDLLRDVEQFLYTEARLLDERRYEEWLALFTDDCRYWVPTVATRMRADGDDVGDDAALAHFDDSKRTLTLRIKRVLSDFAYAEDPPSRTVHVVSNVQVEEGSAHAELTAHSNLIVYRTRLETTTDIFAGRRTDVLRRNGGSWSIARRKVVLAVNVIPSNNLSIFF
jgi:ethylbenzene dioxygenase beta subunit